MGRAPETDRGLRGGTTVAGNALTPAQRDIARRLSEGHLYPQIAADLHVSVVYVRGVVSVACGCLGLVGDRMLLALWYRDQAAGVVGDGED